MNYFTGHAVLGKLEDKYDYVEVYTCHYFGVEGGGRDYFSACFDVFDVTPPIDPVEAERKLREDCEWRVEDWDAESKWELCERLNCRPSELPEAMVEDYLDEFGGDVYAALADECGYSVCEEGEPVVECTGAGQHDAFSAIVEPCLDESVLKEIKRLWDTYHLKPASSISEDDLRKITEIVDILNGAEHINDFSSKCFDFAR